MNTTRLPAGLATAATLCLLSLFLAAPAAAEVSAEAELLWDYDVPEGFSVSGAQVAQTPEGGTLIANTVGQMQEATCTVVLVRPGDGGADDGWEAKAYPYKHGPKGTRCVSALAHPDSGFFVRGIQAGAMEGDVAGFTAHLDGEGNEKWLLHDAEVAGADDFRGSYVAPHGAMAYSSRFEYLMTFTISKFSIAMADEKQVTNLSIIKDGRFRIESKTIGDNAGFGVVGGAQTRASDGYFLLYLYSFGSQGANFYSYNGRESVDRFSPLGEDWSQRFVRRMQYGPQGRMVFLWLKRENNNPDSRLAVVDEEEGDEIWTGAYSAEADVGGQDVLLGLPGDLHVGEDVILISYDTVNGYFARVVDAADGTDYGVVDLSALVAQEPVGVLPGPAGGLKLLAQDRSAGTLYEYGLSFETSVTPGGGDAGLGDAGAPDAGSGDAGDAGTASGGGGDSGGCRAAGDRGPVPTGGGLAVLACLGLLGLRRSGGCGRTRR